LGGNNTEMLILFRCKDVCDHRLAKQEDS